MPQTSFCFLTGLLNALAMDWTGQGPTYRRWRLGNASELRQYGFGMLLGFAIMVGLLIAAVTLGMAGHDILGIAASVLMLGCVFGATIIAARLP